MIRQVQQRLSTPAGRAIAVLIVVLIGLGLRTFSMNASSVPRVKQAVRALNADDCRALAEAVMAVSDPAVIRQMVMGGA